jgi:hypothetical protein
MENRRPKHASIYGRKDKIQVTIIVSSTTKGIYFSFQVVFIYTTFESLSKLYEGCQIMKDLDGTRQPAIIIGQP